LAHGGHSKVVSSATLKAHCQ